MTYALDGDQFAVLATVAAILAFTCGFILATFGGTR